MSSDNDRPARREPNAGVYDLGHWELIQICIALDQLAESDPGTNYRDLRGIFTTDGTVSVTVRDLPE